MGQFDYYLSTLMTTIIWSIKRCTVLHDSNDIPDNWSKRGLPSLASTKRPPSPLEIRRSLSRYVIRSQEFVRSPGMRILRGGWPEIPRAIPATASWRGLRDCWTGDKLIVWPKISIFSGRLTLDLISGGWKEPSLNVTYIFTVSRNSRW